MKQFLKLGAILSGVFLGSFLMAQAATVFYSNQVGSTPVNGYYLQTNGTNSTWAPVSATGGSGTVSTSTVPTVGQLAYWTSAGYPSLLGSVATTSVSCSGSTSCTGFTVIGSSPITISSSGTGTVGTGTTGQFPYYAAGGTTLTATSSLFMNPSGQISIGTTTAGWIAYPYGNPALLADQGTSGSSEGIWEIGNTNNYFENVISNINNGSSASTDLIATNDLGIASGASHYYLDCGIDSSGATVGSGLIPIIGANDTYCYAPDATNFAFLAATTTGNLIFATGGSAASNIRMKILASGNIGIGTTTPQTSIHIGTASTTQMTNLTSGLLVSGQMEVDGNAFLGQAMFPTDSGVVTAMDMVVDSSAANGTVEGYNFNINASSTISLYSKSGGNGYVNTVSVGIATTSPATALDVNGTITQLTVKSCTLGLTTNALGSITGCVASDESLKKNITSPTYSALDIIKELQPVQYQWKDTANRDALIHSGFIAQQVEKVFPSAVVPAGQGLKGVDPNAINALLVKAVQEQQVEIDQLKAQVKALMK